MMADNLIIRKRGILSGLRLDENKISSGLPVEDFGIPDRVIIPMQQHTGAPCNPLVKRGDDVKEGQLIGDSEAAISARIHASISGRVTGIPRIVNPQTSTIISAVEITSEDGRASNGIDKSPQSIQRPGTDLMPARFREISEKMEVLSPRELIDKIKDAGVVGMGGATFPTHVKLSVPPDKIIDTVIINGCECEPGITADHRLMLDYGFEVLSGIYIISRILKPDRVFIAIEDNKEDAILHLEKMIMTLGLESIFRIVSLPSRYPMGAEKTLIKNVLGRKVPAGGLPMDVGVVVNNTGTAKAIFDAVVIDRPLIERVVTITGDIKEPKNLMVRIGTLIGDFSDYFGELDDRDYKIIFGGPMTGFSVVNMDFPVTKGSNCLLVKEEKRRAESNCIRCGRCINVCPMNLMPLIYANYVRNNRYELCRDYYIESCIECGSCAYVCPASIPLVGYIKTGKAALARK
jgi:electron transport complex protein RnfC